MAVRAFAAGVVVALIAVAVYAFLDERRWQAAQDRQAGRD